MPTYDIAGEVCRVCQGDLIADQGVRRCGTCGLPALAPLTQGTMPRGAAAVDEDDAGETPPVEAEPDLVAVAAAETQTAPARHQRRRQ